MSHVRSYLSESDDEQDNKSASENTFDRSCGDGGSSSSLSAITVSVSASSYAVHCLIFTSSLFLTNYPLSSDDMVD